MSISALRPARPVRQIYLDAQKAALKLAAKAEKAAADTDNLKYQQIAIDHAVFAKRFAEKAGKAAEKTITLLNDGTLRSYCERFDRVFAQFVKFAEVAEKELNEIVRQIKTQ